MTTIYCRSCERRLGEVEGSEEGPPNADQVIQLYEKLEGRCPFCGRQLWKEAKKQLQWENGIPLRFFH
jgi:hypothetical protein